MQGARRVMQRPLTSGCLWRESPPTAVRVSTCLRGRHGRRRLSSAMECRAAPESRSFGTRTFGDIAPSNRTYFIAPIVRGATTYRITVFSFDLITGGGG